MKPANPLFDRGWRRPRRAFGVAAAVGIAAVVAVGGLCGCAAEPELSPAAQSASKISFEPAFESDYAVAREAVLQKADDAKLLAVRSSTFSQAHLTPDWSFLFYSRQRVSAYTVQVTDGVAKVIDSPGITMLQEEYDAIPDPDLAILDADAAYQQAVSQLDGTGEYATCRASLVTCDFEDDSSAQAFVWYFAFNEEEDLRDISLYDFDEVAPAVTLAVDGAAGKLP